jgi:hypothetical protein
MLLRGRSYVIMLYCTTLTGYEACHVRDFDRSAAVVPQPHGQESASCACHMALRRERSRYLSVPDTLTRGGGAKP